MHRIDTPGNIPPGLFIAPDPLTGQIAVIVDSAWLNDLQENIMEVLAGGGVAAVKGDYTNLDAAIDNLIAAASRMVLTANTTFYVDPAGNDANSGLTALLPWLTLQHAVNFIGGQVDQRGFTATVQCKSPGAYNAQVAVIAPFTGQVIIQGDNATPANCTITTGGAVDTISVQNSAVLRIQGFTIASAQAAFASEFGGTINFENIAFGACADHMHANPGGNIVALGPYSIVGDATHHAEAFGGRINLADSAITLTGARTFTQFVYADALGLVQAQSLVFSGTGAHTASGSGWLGAQGGYVDTNGTSAAITGTGLVAGSAATGYFS